MREEKEIWFLEGGITNGKEGEDSCHRRQRVKVWRGGGEALPRRELVGFSSIRELGQEKGSSKAKLCRSSELSFVLHQVVVW